MLVPTRVHRFLMQDPIENAGRDFGQLVDRLFNTAEARATAVFPADVREDSDHVYIEAELPGFHRDEVDVTLEKNVLTISAERKAETATPEPKSDAASVAENVSVNEVKQPTWLLRERQSARYLRSFRLPQTTSDGAVEAHYQDGVLFITLNKREESKPRKIAIS